MSFTILAGMAALRVDTGTDYAARYVPWFYAVAQGVPVNLEPGFYAWVRAISALTDDPQWLFVASSLLTVGLYYRFVVRMSASPALSIFIYVFGGAYLEAFNLVRQGIAIAILLNSIEFAMRGKHLRFFALTVLAASFHASALVWLVAWPLMWLTVSRTIRLILAAAAAFLVFVTPQILGALVIQFAPAYAWYFDSNYASVRAFDPWGTFVSFAVFFASLVVIQRGKRTAYEDGVVNILGLTALLTAATLTFSYALSRLTYYFTPVQSIALPLLVGMIRNELVRRYVTLLVMALLLTFFVFKFLIWNSHGVMPYESVFSEHTWG